MGAKPCDVSSGASFQALQTGGAPGELVSPRRFPRCPLLTGASHTWPPPLVTGWFEESRSPQPARSGSLVPPPSSALRTSREASVEDVGCLVCGWSPTSLLGQQVQEVRAGGGWEGRQVLSPFCYLWGNGPGEAECRLKATQRSADRGLGPAFLPVLPPCPRSVLFVLKPVPDLCWSLCVCLSSVLPLA